MVAVGAPMSAARPSPVVSGTFALFPPPLLLSPLPIALFFCQSGRPRLLGAHRPRGLAPVRSFSEQAH